MNTEKFLAECEAQLKNNEEIWILKFYSYEAIVAFGENDSIEIPKLKASPLKEKFPVSRLLHSDIERLIEIVRVQRDALKGYSSLTGRFYGPSDIYDGLEETAINALSRADEISGGK